MDRTFGYWNQVSDAASVEDFQREDRSQQFLPTLPSLISEEALPENGSLLDFKSFATEYPEKLFTLLNALRPEFKELFIEYYILGKSQNFLGKVHGQIQTRIWQNLRLIEQAIGAVIVLGDAPTADEMRPVLIAAGIDATEYGSLASMIEMYAKSRSYANVAKTLKAPTPAIRKIFRPAIKHLLSTKNMHMISIGAYLRNLTHQASLTDSGLSKRYLARLKRLKQIKFTAPEAINPELITYGPVKTLGNTPWNMFEIRTDRPALKVMESIQKSLTKIFRDNAVEIFAPLDTNNELRYGYIFVRCSNSRLIHNLNKVSYVGTGGRKGDPGVLDMSTMYDGEGNVAHAITVPNEDVQKLREAHPIKETSVQVGDFVEVLTGDASHYCGTVKSLGSNVAVEVNFASGRKFMIHAHPTSVRVIDASADRRAFWGINPLE